MKSLRNPPGWWDWELELSPHVERRMEERGFTEVDLRRMLEQAQEIRNDHVERRFAIETKHLGRPWEVILEPDDELECIVVITAYPRE